jgi:hypothetical protein
MLCESGLATVPLVAEGVFGKEQLQALLDTKSQYCDELLEVGFGSRREANSALSAQGLYLRLDDGDHLRRRVKLVRTGFLQSEEFDTHWMKKQLVKNIVLR